MIHCLLGSRSSVATLLVVMAPLPWAILPIFSAPSGIRRYSPLIFSDRPALAVRCKHCERSAQADAL